VTVEEIRAAVESSFAATVSVEGGTYPSEVPADVTPKEWNETVKPDTDLVGLGEGLAMAGLYYGCDHFSPIRVYERGEARVQGHKRTFKRDKAIVVYALGWKGK